MSIRNIVTVGILTGLAGCVTPENINPQDMSKFKSPNEVIVAKNLNGKEGLGKEFLLTIYATSNGISENSDVFLPSAYMEKLCLSQNGQFNQVFKPTFNELKKDVYQLPSYSSIRDRMGTFKCAKANGDWHVSIEPQYTRLSSDGSMIFITVKTRVIDNAIVSANALESARIKQQNDEIQKREAKAESIKWRESIEKVQKEGAEIARKNLESAENHQKYIAANIPTAKDIGHTICNETQLGDYKKDGQSSTPPSEPRYGAAVGTLEEVSNDRKNLKVMLKGRFGSYNSIRSEKYQDYKQTPLESGRVIWDNKDGWYKCNY